MIPSKYMDLDTCALRVPAVVLEALLGTHALLFEDVVDLVVEEAGQDAKYNLAPALSLLYLAGRIEYDESANALVFTGSRTAP